MTNEKDSLLRVFTSLWACSFLISLVAFPQWFDYVVWVQALPAYIELSLALVAGFALFRPSLKSLLLLLVVQILEVLFSMPYVPNHRILMTFVSVAFLASYLASAKKKGRFDLHSEEFFPEAFKIGKMAFLLVYFFAALAKLNTSFLDPSISCSVKFYGNIVSWFPFIPEGKFFNYLSIYAPIALEILIPFGLLSKRFRKKCILIGLLFHFALALDLTQRFLNFSMVISVLYLLFLDPDYLKTLEKKWRDRVPEHTVLIGFIFVFVFGLFQALFTWTTALVIVEHVLWTFIFIGMFLAVYHSPSPILDNTPSVNQRINEIKRSISPLQVCIFLLLILNGSSPYLGTKTRTSFNMYSNLRIEPGFSNHIFMGPSPDFFGNLSDSVEIQTIYPDSLQNDNIKEGRLLTYFEFSRYFAKQKDPKINITYVRNGETLTATFEDPPTPPSWLSGKFLIYRPLGDAVVRECIW